MTRRGRTCRSRRIWWRRSGADAAGSEHHRPAAGYGRDLRRRSHSAEGVPMKAITIAVAAVFVTTASAAHTATIKKREQRQQHRIERGVERGKLTPKETERLENE